MHAERCDLRAHGWCWVAGRRRSGDVWCSDFADGELYEESDAAEWRAAVLERAATRPCTYVECDLALSVHPWFLLHPAVAERCQSTPPSGGA